MWKECRKDFIKQNRIVSVSIICATLITTVFLSLLCSLFYNMWNYDTERIIREEGAWQVKITGRISQSLVEALKAESAVKSVRINENASHGSDIVLELVMENSSAVYKEVPKLIESLGMDDISVEYHTVLLTNYLIFDPDDTTPPLLLLFCILVLIIVSFSLVLIIHNTFEVSMNLQIEQLGTLSEIGATPKQIRNMLIEQALSLSLIPIIVGTIFGICLSAVFVFVINIVASNVEGRYDASFVYHPGILVLTIFISFITIFFSALRPAIKMGKMTPLQVIRRDEENSDIKSYKSIFLGKVFGISGELAGCTLKRQKKSLRTATISLTLSFLGFALTLCFFALSGISTEETYFERYKDVWDVMITVKNTDIKDLSISEKPKGVKDIVVYQRGKASIELMTTELSEELLRISELGEISGVESPIDKNSIIGMVSFVVMDDKSFEQYTKECVPEMHGTGIVIWNYIWNSIDSNFRHKEYIPFLKEGKDTVVLECDESDDITFDVAGYSDKLPILREEYESGSLVLLVPYSLWIEKNGEALCEHNTYIRVLAEDRNSKKELNRLEEEIVNSLDKSLNLESENRIKEEESNRDMVFGLQFVLEALCVLIALIGVANVFSYTFCFANERKKEFARYFSIGMTTKDVVRMLAVEAVVIAGRPLIVTVPLMAAFVVFASNASYINIGRVLDELPLYAMGLFVVVVFSSVALAYDIGVKRLFRSNLIEVLRDDRLN